MNGFSFYCTQRANLQNKAITTNSIRLFHCFISKTVFFLNNLLHLWWLLDGVWTISAQPEVFCSKNGLTMIRWIYVEYIFLLSASLTVWLKQWEASQTDRLYLSVTQLKFTVVSSLSPSPLQQWDISQTKIRVISTLLFVLFGCLLFVALPAAIFKYIEGWSALESLYFVVITLTTIGFGDFVAGTDTLPLKKRALIVQMCYTTQHLVCVCRWVRNRVLGLL